MLLLFLISLLSIAASIISSPHQSKYVSAQYENYPYPPNNIQPAMFQSMAPPVLQSPSHLSEISHHVFNGQINWCTFNLKVLIAGGGTGEKTIQLVRQLMASKSTWHITHLDLSNASVTIAQERIIALFGKKVLQSISFVHGSLLNLNELLPFEMFDYIDWLGVLHTMSNPSFALSMLNAHLNPNGGIGIMVYAPIGRAGVINFQNTVKLLINNTQFASDQDEQLILTKSLLKFLPRTNPLRLDSWRWKKLQRTIYNTTKDSGLVDLFMPAHDVPMTVQDVHDFVEASNMNVQTFVHSALYKLSTYVHDPILLKQLQDILATRSEEESFVELFSGNMFHHFFYVTKTSNPISKQPTWTDDKKLIPIPVRFHGPSLSTALRNLTFYPWKNNNLDLFFRLPRCEGDALLKILTFIDGKNSVETIEEKVQSSTDFDFCFNSLVDLLNGMGKLFMSKIPAQFEELSVDERAVRTALYPNLPRNAWHYFKC
jgi:SAM-dependent methyltransferase